MFFPNLFLSTIGTANILLLFLLLVKIIFHYGQNPLGLRQYLLLVLSMTLFSIASLGSFLATDHYYFNIFLQIMLMCQWAMSTFCLLFFLDMGYWKNDNIETAKKILYGILILHALISLTNSHHNWLYTHALKDTQTLYYTVQMSWWAFVMQNYSIFTLLLTSAVILIALLNKNKKTFELTLCIFFTFAITSTLSILYSKGLSPSLLNPIGFFLALPAAFVYYACFGYLDQARPKAIDLMDEAYFVFDLKGDLIDKNTSAEKFIQTYFSEDNIKLRELCKLIGLENIDEVREQDFSIKSLDKPVCYFLASYFQVSDSVSQMCGHGFLIRETTKFREQVQLLNTAANIDSLTGVKNRRYFDLYCKNFYKNHSYPAASISLLMLDLDHFKRVNDTYGHSTGDEILKSFCDICLDNLRANDILFRVGGEEFVIIVDDADAEVGQQAAERIRAAVARYPILTNCGPVEITVSIGGCSASANTDLEISELVEEADRQLYKAKHAGRNCVSFIDLSKD